MKTKIILILLLISISSIAFSQKEDAPILKEPEFLRVINLGSRTVIEFDLFIENTTTIEIICTDLLTKRTATIPENTITLDQTYTIDKSYRAKLTLPDIRKEYIYTFVARNSLKKSNPFSYYYQPQNPDLIIGGDIQYSVVNKNDLKVVWNLSSSINSISYGYSLKIKNGDFIKTIQGKIANLNDNKIFEDVFVPGNTYKINLEVGANEFITKQIKNDVEIKVESEKPLDFVSNSYPAIIFFNNGTSSGVKVKFQTTKPCLAKLEINASSDRNTFISKGSSTKTDKHEIEITDALNFVAIGNESVAYLNITLNEIDSDGNPIIDKSKSATFGLGGASSSSQTKIDLEKREKAKETSKKIGEVVGAGLKGLMKTVIPIPL